MLSNIGRNWSLLALQGALAVILNEWPMGLGGVLLYAIVAGISQISLGWRLRGLDQTLQPRREAVTSSAR